MIFESRQTENYRTATNDRHGKPKKVAGRKSLGWKAGFQCAECVGGSHG